MRKKQPIGNIQELGTGRIKKVFTDDIDQIESGNHSQLMNRNGMYAHMVQLQG